MHVHELRVRSLDVAVEVRLGQTGAYLMVTFTRQARLQTACNSIEVGDFSAGLRERAKVGRRTNGGSSWGEKERDHSSLFQWDCHKLVILDFFTDLRRFHPQ